MARAGNHGIIVPRDRALLYHLYWDDGLSLPKIGRMFGVTHKSVERVMRQLDIPRRPKHTPRRTGKCVECGEPTVNIKHAGHGYVYGNRCRKHWNAHRARLARDYIARRPDVRAKRKLYLKRWYDHGAINPTSEEQWIRKGKHLLRTTKRMLRESREV